ncbi:hypothetical protein V1282_005636 [Nitrobacteraceae bacterium AZCC 2146]
MSDAQGPLPADDLPGGFKNRLKWAYASVYRWIAPLNPAEVRQKFDAWRKAADITTDATVLKAHPSRCCVMNIPGIGRRCSTQPSDASECRILARQFHPDATGHFYPNPCADCESLD